MIAFRSRRRHVRSALTVLPPLLAGALAACGVADTERTNSAMQRDLGADGGVTSDPHFFSVTLPADYAGSVSAAVYAADGQQIIRTLKESEPHAAGATVTFSWDGLDDFGNRMKPGGYTWRAIATKAHAVYEGHIGDLGNPPTTGNAAGVSPVAIDASGNVYEGSGWEEPGNESVRAWGADGTLLAGPRFNTKFTRAMALDNDYIYLARHIDGDGARIERYSKASPNELAASPFGTVTYIHPTTAAYALSGIAVDNALIWASNYASNTLEAYDKSSGALVASANVTAACGAAGVAADGAGNAWLACMKSGTVTRYARTVGSTSLTAGTTISSLTSPFAVAFGGPSAQLYVADAATSTVSTFNPSSPSTATSQRFGKATPGPIDATHMRWSDTAAVGTGSVGGGIAVNASGTLVVSDPGNRRVEVFDSSGTRIANRFSEFDATPQVDAAFPDQVLSGPLEYHVDYTTTGADGRHPWEVVNNWTPSHGVQGFDYGGSAVKRRLDGRDYIFYLGTRQTSDLLFGVVVYEILKDAQGNPTGLRLSARTGTTVQAGTGLYNATYPGDGVSDTTSVASNTVHPGTLAQSVSPNPGWWVDQEGALWCVFAGTGTVRIPLDGFVGHNPVYNWEHLQPVIPTDTSYWAFQPVNMRVHAPTRDIYRIGASLLAPPGNTAEGGIAGNVIERRTVSTDYTSLTYRNVMRISDPADPTNVATARVAGGWGLGPSAVAPDTDGKFFYVGMSGGPRFWVKMYTADGMLVTTTLGHEALEDHPGWIDVSLGLTGFTSGTTHYVYGSSNVQGASLRWRIDDPDVRRLNPGGETADPFQWDTTVPWQAITIRAATASIPENSSTVGNFELTRTNVEGALSVQVAASGTAASGTNYTALNSTVTFPNGSATVLVPVHPRDDGVRTTAKTLTLTVAPDSSGNNNYGPGMPSVASMTIQDASAPVSVTAVQGGSEAGPVSAIFSIARDQADDALTVNYEVSEPKIKVLSASGSSTLNGNYVASRTFDGARDQPWMSNGNSPIAPQDDTPALTLVLDGTKPLGRMRISNYNGGVYTRSVKDVDILVSADNGATFTSTGVHRFAVGAADAANAKWESVDLGGVTANQVRLKILSNWAGKSFYNNCTDLSACPSREAVQSNSLVGLSEVEFFAKGVTPADYALPVGATVQDGVMSGSVVIPAGAAATTLSVLPVDDPFIERGGPEAMEIRILPTGSYRVVAPSSAVTTVTDNDDGPDVSIAATKATASKDGSDFIEYTVTRTGTTGDLAVKYVSANDLVPVASVTASSSLGGAYAATNVLDGNLQTDWLHAGNAVVGYGGQDDRPYIRFALDSVKTIGRFRVSNYNTYKSTGDKNRGAKDVEVWTSVDSGATYTRVGSAPFVFTRGVDAVGSETWQDIDLGGVDAQLVELRIKDNYNNISFWNNCSPLSTCPSYTNGAPSPNLTGISEIQMFTGSSARTSDFSSAPLTGTIVIPAGSTSATIRLTPKPSSVSGSGTRALKLTLVSDDKQYVVATPSSATATIQDAVPLTISAVSASSFFNFGGVWMPANTIDGDLHTGWITPGNGSPAFNVDHDDEPSITYTFSQVRHLGHFDVSPYSTTSAGSPHRSAKHVEVWASLDGTTFDNLVGTYVFGDGTNDPALVYWQGFEMGGVDAKAVKLKIKDNYYGVTFYNGCSEATMSSCPSYENGACNASYTGFSEIRFFTASP